MIVLEGRGISKQFDALQALDAVDFVLHDGEILGLIGPNGSGKTTLLNVITGTYHADRGDVLYRGKRIGRTSPNRICRMGIGRTFQLIHPFESMTVVDNVLVGATFGKAWRRGGKAALGTAESILKEIGLGAKRDASINELTISELRLLELGRALATDPQTLLLDEVMAGLTSAETEYLMETVRGIRKRGRSIIMIEHVMKAIMGLSDRVIALETGRKIADGKPEEVACDPHVIECYLGKDNGRR